MADRVIVRLCVRVFIFIIFFQVRNGGWVGGRCFFFFCFIWFFVPK